MPLLVPVLVFLLGAMIAFPEAAVVFPGVAFLLALVVVLKGDICVHLVRRSYHRLQRWWRA